MFCRNPQQNISTWIWSIFEFIPKNSAICLLLLLLFHFHAQRDDYQSKLCRIDMSIAEKPFISLKCIFIYVRLCLVSPPPAAAAAVTTKNQSNFSVEYHKHSMMMKMKMMTIIIKEMIKASIKWFSAWMIAVLSFSSCVRKNAFIFLPAEDLHWGVRCAHCTPLDNGQFMWAQVIVCLCGIYYGRESESGAGFKVISE